ncbi:MAG: T9SS type A sorting domain-containing protein [Gemmatimonadota bacterium]|nr:MAG: T9SS type A sorting domain-containing protein [Gemmatimonadota bacterium]
MITHTEHLSDEYNVIGTHQAATMVWDKLDHPEPPPVIGKYVSSYFPHHDWQKYPDNYTTDFRPPFIDGQIWDFVVETNVLNSTTKITVQGVESVPDEFEVYLLDDDLNISQNLRQNQTYSFPTFSKKLKKQLRLAVGKSDFFQINNLQMNPVPFEYELSQNFPNPFNTSTAIHYGLLIPARVTLTIHNILGEEVKTLIDREREAGYYTVTWDARDDAGRELSSGIYFYRLKAGQFTATKRMVLLK